MRRCLLTLATAHALRANLMLLPGASTGRITEDEARKRTSWPHWKRESDWTADDEAPAVVPRGDEPPTVAAAQVYQSARQQAAGAQLADGRVHELWRTGRDRCDQLMAAGALLLREALLGQCDECRFRALLSARGLSHLHVYASSQPPIITACSRAPHQGH